MTDDTLTRLPLADMMVEVREVNAANGWHDDDRSLYESLMLLDSEVAEAVEAYRRWGLEDATDAACEKPDHHTGAIVHGYHTCKPEGVGSELADVLIRLLDTANRSYVPPTMWEHAGTVSIPVHHSFVDSLFPLTKAITRLEMPSPVNFAVTYATLTAVATRAGVDLAAEYERKIAYNRTRGYRHGNKKL